VGEGVETFTYGAMGTVWYPIKASGQGVVAAAADWSGDEEMAAQWADDAAGSWSDAGESVEGMVWGAGAVGEGALTVAAAPVLGAADVIGIGLVAGSEELLNDGERSASFPDGEGASAWLDANTEVYDVTSPLEESWWGRTAAAALPSSWGKTVFWRGSKVVLSNLFSSLNGRDATVSDDPVAFETEVFEREQAWEESMRSAAADPDSDLTEVLTEEGNTYFLTGDPSTNKIVLWMKFGDRYMRLMNKYQTVRRGTRDPTQIDSRVNGLSTMLNGGATEADFEALLADNERFFGL